MAFHKVIDTYLPFYHFAESGVKHNKSSQSNQSFGHYEKKVQTLMVNNSTNINEREQSPLSSSKQPNTYDIGNPRVVLAVVVGYIIYHHY
jgi:hypothetical protein